MSNYDGVDREEVWAAFFALLKAQLGSQCVTMGRQHVQPPRLSLEQQPALFLVQGRETRAPRPSGLPNKLTLSGFVVVYFEAPMPSLENTGDETVLGATTINALLKGIDDAMVPDDYASGRLTLGGLVEHCWIEGDVDIDPGIYSQQGAAILPVRILVP